MLKRIVPMMLLGLCVFARLSAAQQPPVIVLLDNARDFANQVVGFAGDTRISGTRLTISAKAKRGSGSTGALRVVIFTSAP